MVPITVLMAVYNPPLDLLGQAVDSILGQTCGDFEFLIIDDGSDPGAATANYLAARAAGDMRIRLAREPHRGLTASLNRGLEMAQGAWIARQDADDWSDPERLEHQLGFLKRHSDVMLCGSNAWTHQQTGRVLWRTRLPLTHAEILTAFQHANPFVHGSTMYSRRHARAIGGYCEAFRCAQDYDFFWRLAETGSVTNLEEPLYHYRYTAGSVSANRAAEQNIAVLAAGRLAARRRSGPSDPLIRARLEAVPDPDAGQLASLEVWTRRQFAEVVRAELEAAGREVRRTASGILRARLRQADHLLLAGAYRRAWRAYVELAKGHPASGLAWAKLARCGAFLALPAMRDKYFHEGWCG